LSDYIWEKSQEEKIKDEQPTKISQLENDVGYITNNNNDLPTTYPPSAHKHSKDDIDGLEDEINNTINGIIIKNSNFFIASEAEINKLLVWVNGNTGNEPGSIVSGFIPCITGERFMANYNLSQLMFYDINKVYVGTYRNGELVDRIPGSTYIRDFIVPPTITAAQIAYLRFSIRGNFLKEGETIDEKNIIIEKDNRIVDLTPIIISILSQL